MATTTDLRFDCLAFKRKVQEEIYQRIRDLTPEQQTAYFREAAETGPLGAWWKTVRDRR